MSHSHGLLPLRKDRRDWSYHKNFGAIPTPALPDEYDLSTTILDQNGWNECTGYMRAGIDEAEFSIPFNPAFNYAMEGEEEGSVSLNGYDMRAPFQAGCDYGALPLGSGQPSESTNGLPYTADPKNWQSYITAAGPYQRAGYATINGPYDLFDSIRSAMYQESPKKRAPGAGVMWMNEWTTAENGVIQDGAKSPDGNHAIKIAGWVRHLRNRQLINPTTKEQYLKIQNTWSEGVGDGGFFYISRTIANKIFDPLNMGVFIFTDNPGDNPKTRSMLQNLLNALAQLLKSLQGRFGYPPAQPSPQPTPTPPAPPQPAPPVHQTLIPALAAGIWEAEGGGKQAGLTLGYNNPGDIRGRIGNKYQASLGVIGYGENNLAKFTDLAAGQQATIQLCTDVANGLIVGYPRPACTIKDFVKVYADPQTQAEWDNYVAIVCRHTGKTPVSFMKELL